MLFCFSTNFILSPAYVQLTLQASNRRARAYASPFKIEFYTDDELVAVFNEQNRLTLERVSD